ncbi:MAG: hypothetical protein WC539_00105 [Nitrospirota bacterium]
MRTILCILLVAVVTGCATMQVSKPSSSSEDKKPAPSAPLEVREQPVQAPQAHLPSTMVLKEDSVPPVVEESSETLQKSVRQSLPRKDKQSFTYGDRPIPADRIKRLTYLAETNDEKIVNVFTGMSKRTVEGIMGNVQNPYKREIITGSDSIDYEILFYLTREPRKGRPITNRMLTPIILKNGHVIAIGIYHLKKLIKTGTLARRKSVAAVSR